MLRPLKSKSRERNLREILLSSEQPPMSSLQTKSFHRFVAALILILGVLFLPPGAPSQELQRKEMTLKNGARLEGDILRESPERVFLDLGFDVLTLPRTAIESIQAVMAGDSPTTMAAEGAETDLDTVEARKFRSQTAMIEYTKPGVVVVSNPGGFGAGFLIDRKGRLLTNNHVVRDQQYHAVTLVQKGEDGVLRHKKIENVELVAFSRLMDVALLQIPAKDLEGLEITPLPLAESFSISSGDSVYAIGNPGMGRQMLDHSVSSGIVSSTNRSIGDILYMQTTAAINPGNSGGPLINEQGEVVGLVTLKAIYQESIGFALPINYVRLFLMNEKSFAFDKNNPNYAYRYLAPGRTLETESTAGDDKQ